MENMIIKAKKLNMSQIFLDSGKVMPVTSLLAEIDLTAELEDKKVVLEGVSKGKGFTGVMKKWGFHGQQATRGQSDRPRMPGAIGAQTPGRVLKGKKMAGRHGNFNVTIKGLKIVKVLPEKRELLVSGPVPGARNSKITLTVL
jgi:large subunit ribosomal protein L3